MVMFEQSTEELLALDCAGCEWLEILRRAERVIAFRLMWPFCVIKVDVTLSEMAHVPFAEDDEMV